MTPLILRPEPQASNFAQLLRSAGHQPVVTPLLTIIAGRELASLPEWLLWADIVVAVSAAAVEQGNAYLTKAGIGWPDKPCLAVGNATAASWQEAGVSAHYPQDARSEGLLSLPELGAVAGKKVLILRGDGGRAYLGEQLEARGAIIRYGECYRRHWLEQDGNLLFTQWHTARVDSVMLTSGELLNRLLAIMPHHALPWLQQLTWIVPSARVANLVQDAGLPPAIVAADATPLAMLAALETR